MNDLAPAVLEIARSVGLDCDHVLPLRSTNNTVFLLDHCAIVAKVHSSEVSAGRELHASRALVAVGAPVVPAAMGIGDFVHKAGRLYVTFWEYIEEADLPSSAAVAAALHALHQDLVCLVDWVHGRAFEEQLSDAISALGQPTFATALGENDRRLLLDVLERTRSVALQWPREVVHGSPHRMNILSREGAPVFIDLETIQVGPIEWDLAHLEAEVADGSPGEVVEARLGMCRTAVSATTATWCWGGLDRGPDMRSHAEHHLGLVRSAR